MTAPLIIGIHGLSNKPEQSILKEFWKTSICEGLTKNQDVSNPQFDFELVYWADEMYKYPLQRDENFASDDLYNEEPYVEAEPNTLKPRKEYFLDELFSVASEATGAISSALNIDAPMSLVADLVMKAKLKDLYTYYTNAQKAEKLRGLLKNVLQGHQDRKVMLVAHSMGSIIAYDTLTLMGKAPSTYGLDSFITIGSPLGMQIVKDRIVDENPDRGPEENRLRTPTAVKAQWVNFADRRDPVAIDPKLKNDFGPNGSGVSVRDDMVLNDYRILKAGRPEPEKNPHKSYGYLCTPEFSALVKKFLG